MTAMLTPTLSEPLSAFFSAEISNERFGGVSPSTLSSAIDSLAQCPDAFDLDIESVVDLALLRDILPGDTELADLLRGRPVPHA